MQQNDEELQNQYRRDIEAVLDILTNSLKLYIKRELINRFGQNWEEKVFRMAGQKPNLSGPSALLKTMLNQWWDVFHERLGHKGKNLVGDIIEWRNVSAHRAELSLEDVIRCFDSAARLLEMIVPLQQSDAIVVSLQDIKTRKTELELQRLNHLIPPKKEKVTNSTKPVTIASQLGREIVDSSQLNQADITEPAILLRIDNSYREDMTSEELYQVARGDWKMAPEKRRYPPRYAMAVADRVIREVYEIQAWHPVYESQWYQNGIGSGRWRFDGVVASDKSNLIGKSVNNLIHPRSSSTIQYINC